ncbi:MAG: phytanoyl-CoA dioxygenase family protein [Pseudomonadales bacterium]
MLRSNGVELATNPASYGALEPGNHLLDDPDALRARMQEQGYLLFRGLIDPRHIAAARAEILLKYATIGELNPTEPLDEAIYGDSSALAHINLRAFTQSVRDGQAYQNVVLDETLLKTVSTLLGGPARAFDFRWPRFARPGEGCGVHCDGPYLTRGTEHLFSSWIPLGRVTQIEGALMILERGPRHQELLAEYLAKDADEDHLEWIGNPRTVQEQFGTRWLSTDFEPGDVLCFAMDTVHAALDNQSPVQRCRLSSDSRYQLASDAQDQRWNGPQPQCHGPDKVFFPGLGSWNNKEFQDEWKTVDAAGRLVIAPSDGLTPDLKKL